MQIMQEKPTEQQQPSETQLSVQSVTDRLMMNLNNKNKTLHETNKQLSKDTKKLQEKIDSLNTELTEKVKDIPSIFVILAATGIIGTILFCIIKNIIPFFKAYWNFTQTAVTIILFSLLICFSDVINIKGILNVNLAVLFFITDLIILVIRAVYDCIKNR